MGGRWGPDGPPEEAYSRVTRNLQAVFGGLHPHADRLVNDLAARHGAQVTAPTQAEALRLARHLDLLRAVVVRPPDPAASPLVMGWTAHPAVVVAFGNHLSPEIVPTCGCDACDEDLGDAVREVDEVVAGVVGGFDEVIRRRFRNVEVGYRMPHRGAGSWLWPGEVGQSRLPRRPKTITWAPWAPRSLAPPQ